jgi:hypothetical protein
MAREQAKAAVMEQIAEELAERDARRAERGPKGTPASAPALAMPAAGARASEASPPPASVEEAEQRFYARYADVIGGRDWGSVQRYTGIKSRSPTNIKAWYAVAEAVARKMQTTD